MSSSTCPVCGSVDLAPVIHVADTPALSNAFASTAEEAKGMPRGDIELVSCERCGMLHNASFDPRLAPYDSAYENSLHFSPRFQTYAEALAEDLAARFGVEGGTVVEIGSGGGDFLAMVAAHGFGSGVGIDPSLPAARDGRAGEATLTFLPGTLAEAPAGLQADLVICRHVLEHVPDPVGLLREAREAVSRDGASLYVEVPDGEHMLEAPAIWDLIYEHVGYFNDAALRTALAAAGWVVQRSGSSFGGQYRWAEATTAGPVTLDGGRPGGPEGDVSEPARRFAEVYSATVRRWSRFMEAERAAGRRVAAWGAGSKGVTFANSMAHGLDAMVDINERKHGRFVPGTGQRVSSPAEIAGRVDTVLVMNPIYLDEVEAAGTAAGVDATFLPVG